MLAVASKVLRRDTATKYVPHLIRGTLTHVRQEQIGPNFGKLLPKMYDYNCSYSRKLKTGIVCKFSKRLNINNPIK